MPTNVIAFSTGQPVADVADIGDAPTTNDVPASTAADTNASEATTETTPIIYPCVPVDVYLPCKAELGLTEFVLVPVRPIENADPTNYVLNIAQAMLETPGRPVFGYRIQTSALYVAAQFYAMFETDTGLVDLTPNTQGESYKVFVPDRDVPPDFDYLDRPVTRRFRTFEAPTRRQRVAAEIAAMDPRRLASERRRAADQGLALEDVLSLTLPLHALETRLDLFFECCEELEALTMAALDGREAVDVNHFSFLHRRRASLEAMLDEAYAQHKARTTKSVRKRGR
ncbi:hypothetical protein [Bradyrhizobium sp. WSM471]|uniref:hypothetical protein n=1 Tax=Bradyrhizobium sp. WSM471 TaxID=319017 RepID=UPI00024D1AB6|nr:MULTISPECIES: hypothetical protein [Bradyrhizobium]EHR00193.1 hypothetical protein Bra471DRAFT_00739 [Bradyrhizobium sp. WSM471]UFW42313.1 hypothetical protein BcanWSM471_03635 [Bradyrhizobium canariense]